MEKMTKRERVMAAVKGKPLDRLPISYFNHNHAVEHSPDALVPALVQHNQKFDWDFIKVMLRASYYMEAWGNTYRFDPDRGPILEDFTVKNAEDYEKMKKLDPTQGPFGEQVQVARMLAEALGGKVPYVQTVFSPLTVAGRLAGGIFGASNETEAIRRFADESPDALQHGLSIISETLADYARECIRAGADGLFYTTTAYATLDIFSEQFYMTFGIPYDLPILNAAIKEGATLNVLHICRENIMFDLLSDYPVEIINYESTSSRNPSLKEAMVKTKKALWGGMDQRIIMPKGPIEAIKAQVRDAMAQTGGRRFILGPGCTNVSLTAPDKHLMVMKEAAGWRS